ncbi:cryptochrome/photolyase family protein [Marinobacterium sediminicola]|uniref:Deoxyribodipyrimidine photolyase-related protein n=1 Tax=Marinobacterium sediminicola TaxID=518898 RepID=A0ABY1S0L6_9GAMM|nr:cryptochrome/photolyase family protein [Marinobacterium sediminicola]ULG69720.1 cryptochrome/photolyase family protein [Marinobacterium sediminicola]SMR74549.1 deoxyribodipyrimidine photolyase-related protein [Marinobacterium sediminicola]
MPNAPRLRLVLGDQLNLNISSLRDADPSHDLILMCELSVEATYVRHHKQKLVLVLSAMRHFAKQLKEEGFKVRYLRLDDTENSGSFTAEIEKILSSSDCRHCVMTEPGEYRLKLQFEQWQQAHPEYTLEVREDDRFLCRHEEFRQWTEGRKQLRMEYFYRWMRRRYKLLMDGEQPVGGNWNLDAQNRNPLPDTQRPPKPVRFPPDRITQEVIDLVEDRFHNHFGDLHEFGWGVTAAHAKEALDSFIRERLPLFGDYQDAMRAGDPWLYHSHLSVYINLGLLDPMQAIRAAEAAYESGSAPLNAVEGFIRQILGWREFVRGLYWLWMPDYPRLNYLQADRPLPGFYWDAKTDMHCLQQCIQDTHKHAYAHHIQRLMVLGNFALLAGIDPTAVNEWYLLVYADAYEWVELPNVHGMILYADGGALASKPYAAGGAYINRMSNYCTRCRYDVKQKTGTNACPFNYLYWHFLERNINLLRHNPRMALAYRNLERMKEELREETNRSAQIFLQQLD